MAVVISSGPALHMDHMVSKWKGECENPDSWNVSQSNRRSKQIKDCGAHDDTSVKHCFIDESEQLA